MDTTSKGIRFYSKQFVEHHRNNWIKWFPHITITPYPQLSGLVFVWLQLMKTTLCPKRSERFPNTDANRFATTGLTISSLLFWNYVMHCKYKEIIYKTVCALDYMMITTTTLTSTFPKSLKTRKDAMCVMCTSALDQLFHYYRYGDTQFYKHHHYVCYLSTAFGLYRSYISKQWMPTFLRLYSTTICTLIFYTSIAHLKTIRNYRQVPWYLPWLWHLHAAICQHASIELTYHAIEGRDRSPLQSGTSIS